MGRPKKSDDTRFANRLSLEMASVYGRRGAGTSLAFAVNVSTGQVSRWENGRNLPSYGMMIRIARALGVNPAWLAFGEDLCGVPKDQPWPGSHRTIPEDIALIAAEDQMERDEAAQSQGKGELAKEVNQAAAGMEGAGAVDAAARAAKKKRKVR